MRARPPFAWLTGMAAEQRVAHECHVYRDVADRAHRLTLFLSDGLRAGDQCRVIAYTHSPDRAVGALAGAGFDIADVLYNEALDVIPAASTPLLAMPFDAQAALEWLRALAASARRDGFGGLRVAIEMRWALSSSVGEAGLAAFERGLNTLVREEPVRLLCQYDAGVFPPDLLHHAARVHAAKASAPEGRVSP